MGLPIATTGGGICFAFPDVCSTYAGIVIVPVPYPNIGQLSDAENVSTTVKVADNFVILKGSNIPTTMGDEAGCAVDLFSGKVEFSTASETVKVDGDFVVRMTDSTTQNNGNAIGVVLGGVSNVLCG